MKALSSLIVSIVVLVISSFSALADLTLFMSAEPAHPVIGDTVTWKIHVEGGDTNSPYSFAWNADAEEFPNLYNWNKNYPYQYARSVTNIYQKAGDKTVSVTAYNGKEWVNRSMTIHVSEAKIIVTSPDESDVWYVGKTYEIKWSTHGQADMVQIGLWDFRYNTESGDAGETIIAFKVPNTGSYLFTVPPPNPNGISAGNIGGRNYQISVSGFGDCVGDFTEKFRITRLFRTR